MDNKKLIMFASTCIGAAVLGGIMMGKFGAIGGAAIGLFVPGFMSKYALEARRTKFNNQLVDAVTLLVSCLRAGLSLNQAIEILCQEMPAPLADEFKIVLKSIRIGVPLEEAFVELSSRVPLEELKFVISAVLVARETGGDLPSVLMKLVDTLRDRARLRENIATYTIQGKIQGFIMGFIPVGFVIMVLQQNPHHFDVMWEKDIGRLLMISSVVLTVLAWALVWKISKVEI
jgi:tight adherence protein B